MSIITSPLLLGADGVTQYQISRSLRFNARDSAYLSRNFPSSGNRTTFTYALWVKRSAASQPFQSLLVTPSNNFIFRFESDTLTYYDYTGSSFNSSFQTAAVYRDFSAWMHVVFVYDSTNAVSADRIKLFVNGERVTTFSTSTYGLVYPSLNANSYCNNNVEHRIGSDAAFPARLLDGYLAEVHFIDGQALDPSSFTTTDANGELQPKLYTGSYGTNGFKLNFSDNSTTAALGTDTSGNGNTWTVNNFSVSQGNGSYVSGQFSGDVRSLTDAHSPRNMFNGILGSESVSGAVCFSSYSSNSICTWTPATTITGISSLRIYADLSGLGAGRLSVNGTDYSSLVTALSGGDGWITIPQSSLSSIAFGYTGGLDTATGIAAVEVNGVILLDNFINSNIDSLVDTPTSYGTSTGVGGEVRGNYCTLNPLFSGTTLTNGNLDAEGPSNNWFIGRGTIAFPDSAKWYFEATITGTASASYSISVATASAANSVGDVTTATGIYGIVNNTGTTTTKFINGTASTISTAAAWAQGDILMCAYDGATSKVWFGRNGTWYPPTNGGSAGNPGAGTNETMTASGTVFPAVHCYGTTADMAVNFGQRAFAYTAPTNFQPLLDTLLPAPVVAKGSSAMDVALFTGNGSSQNVTGLNFAPDFVWAKRRSAADSHLLFDVIRGATVFMGSDTTNGDQTLSSGLTAFNSDGFSWGSYGSGATFVGWCWDAGTSTVTNTAGSISSQVRANASAGFSVVTYTVSSSSQTAGHGLGVAPSFVICKRRNSTSDWYFQSMIPNANGYLLLNSTAALTSTSYSFTSTTFPVAYLGGSNEQWVAYCFAPVSGYSSFGSYTGNGSTEGPFVFTGMRPRFLMVKRTDNTTNWFILDTARNTYNAVNSYLMPNSSSAEDSNNSTVNTDFVSNGFKLRATTDALNASGGTYVYACFAESPFAYSRAR
jgi:hypothetical protein